MSRTRLFLSATLALNCALVILNICYGSISIPFGELFDYKWHFIVFNLRMPAAVTAALTGAALGTCGLLLQSYFFNPLAGPSILGITSGANLMVAIVALGAGSVTGLSGTSTMSINVLAALMGAGGTLLLLLFFGRIVRTQVTLLIIGILISYLTSALITLLGYHATAEGLQKLLIWGMGDFNSVGRAGLLSYTILIIIGLGGATLLIKPLNGWMMGELYARNMGIDANTVKWQVLAVTGLLAGVSTAWCGPIAFVGLAMPHAARLMLKTDDHRALLPASMALGALCCSLCLLISTMPNGGTLLPINALTPLFGIPIILFVLLKKD